MRDMNGEKTRLLFKLFPSLFRRLASHVSFWLDRQLWHIFRSTYSGPLRVDTMRENGRSRWQTVKGNDDRGKMCKKPVGKVLLLPVGLSTGRLCVSMETQRGSHSAADKKPASWLIFPSPSNYSQLHLYPTEAYNPLQLPHLMQPTKECNCA